ncbi:uncharacterized protein PAC_05420 [Phialocephala subalpina]|uniref:NB-ARC domain-containing protein n=1 Tax=Phialocephala subalpina TaxID=576137 RepID=A0A1L7WRY6_9HELO|nr:uncharacterized protein PAC_05420 [Phialocephala subalpina]
MDPLSIVAIVAGLITITQAVAQGLTTYIMAVKGAPTEMQILVEELKSLNDILGEIQRAFENKEDGQSLTEAGALTKTLLACQQILSETLIKLEEFEMSRSGSSESLGIGSKYKQLLKKMTHPFKRDEIQRPLVVVRDYKVTLTLAMTLEEKKSTNPPTSKCNILQTLISGMGDMRPPSYSSVSEAPRKKYFEVPLRPTNTFLGRDSFLTQIQDHFNDPLMVGQQHRLAIHGLGGSGKTQIALTYAFNHRSDYDSVFFLNAASSDSLTRDFIKLHQILNLGAVDANENKVECVKRWFTRSDNTSWLIIFDNADDIEDIDLSSYFPLSDTGDILITTHDHRIEHPDLTTCALHLDVLSPEDAEELLVKRAAIQSLTLGEEQKFPALIVKELGYLPLAIDQAGAYIRARRKKLSEYYAMYQDHQPSLLSYRSKLSKHEKTVMTTWELSFNKIEEESPDIAEFVLLLCQYDPALIQHAMLKKGSSSVPASMIRLLGNEFMFDEAVEKLLLFSLAQVTFADESNGGSSGFVLHPMVQFCGQIRATEEIQKKSFEDAVCITSHAYPMGNLDEWDTAFSTQLLSQVQYLCNNLEKWRKKGQKFKRLADVGPSLFLAAFHFADLSWCKRFVTESEGFLTDSHNPFLAAFVVERRGKISLQLGQEERGLEILSSFVQNPPNIKGDPSSSDPAKQHPHNLANSMHGCVYIMLAHQLYTLGRSDETLSVILSWHSFQPSSISSRATERYRDRTLADIYVGRKDWVKAETVLQALLAPDMRDAKSFKGSMGEGWAIHQLADIYIETKRYKEASALTMPALLDRQQVGNESKEEAILIMLDLICSLLALKTFDMALFHLSKLRQVLEPKFGANLIVMGNLTNTWCLLARLSIELGDLKEARVCWEKALDVAGKVKWINGQMVSAIRCSLGYTLGLLGELDSFPDLKLERGLADLETGRELENVGIDRAWVDRLEEKEV